MRKIGAFLVAVLILSQCAACKSVPYTIDFTDLYHQVIGFSDNNVLYKSVGSDAVLMVTSEEYQKFMDAYFTERALPIPEPDEDKAVIYLQFPGERASAYPYTVKSVIVERNALTVTVRKAANDMNVDPTSGFDGIFYWVAFLEVDKTKLQHSMDIRITEAS